MQDEMSKPEISESTRTGPESSIAVRRILVPVDASPCCLEATKTAASLASALEASITVLHAYHPMLELGSALAGATISTASGEMTLIDHMRREAQKTVDEHVERLREMGVAATGRLVEGPAKAMIVSSIEEGDFDLVVMGTHGRTGLAHLLMGSVAEWVVRHAPVPVLTVHDTKEPAQVA